jgi:2-polyprenyl-6-methoxyphenol hydroxylase-like FAD-dependent oxidoreductase
MSVPVRRVVVVGAGLAGLSCALAMAHRGVRVQVVEEGGDARPWSAHVDVVPNLIRDLAVLGVGEACVRVGFPYQGVDVADQHGRLLYRVDSPRLAGRGYPAALGIALGELLQLLKQALVVRGVAISCGGGVAALHRVVDGARVEMRDGTQAEADTVLLAVGSVSPLRRALFPEAPEVASLGQRWWYVPVPRPPSLNRPLIVTGTAGRRAWLVPTRQDQASVSYAEPDDSPMNGTPAQHLREALSRMAAPVRELARFIDDATEIGLRPVRSGVLPSPWHAGPVLAVGQCAHTFPPHFGQAAAQAVEDARVVSDLLDGTRDRDDLFKAFMLRRLDRVRRIHEITTQAARWDLQPDASTDFGALLRQLSNMVAQPA